MIDSDNWSMRAMVKARGQIPGLLVLVAASCGGSNAALAQSNPDRQIPSLAPMIEQISPAVVNISVSGSVLINSPLAQDEFFRRFFQLPDGRQEIRSAGSGVIVDAEQGYILTNHHVVENADTINVTLLDNRSMDARVVGSDQGSDLAVLQVEAADLAEMPLGNSDQLRVGDYVVAIGNPFGFSHTVTSGIVSGLGRSGINPDGYEDFIQTDASINPGNSGGALVNLNGELVGINSVIVSRSGGNIGIGFAIPVNMARGIMEQLITFGEVSRGLLGVSINSLTAENAQLYGLSDISGALVVAITPDSAAENAGIQINDVIVSVNDHRVNGPGSLKYAIGLLRPGEQVRVGFIRDGREQTVTAVLGELADGAVTETFPRSAAELDPAFSGAKIIDNDASGVAGLLVAGVAT
ncbi:MAG TPA: Do family serine endopeptidase, partial [Gammaproteobacteria bacterium]|nr:Do family serine endopeptidase [Gammaproteobacteria bacterium]